MDVTKKRNKYEIQKEEMRAMWDKRTKNNMQSVKIIRSEDIIDQYYFSRPTHTVLYVNIIFIVCTVY